ncbi:MAG: hypothetical protein H6Q00_956 [Holophagaceae bacterium]|nr:hypothetical protein [Holophagaceae bacterium]
MTPGPGVEWAAPSAIAGTPPHCDRHHKADLGRPSPAFRAKISGSRWGSRMPLSGSFTPTMDG